MAGENINDLKEQLKLLKDILKTQKNLGTEEQKRIVASISSTERLIKNLEKYDGTLDDIQRGQKDLVDGANQFGNAIANLPIGDYLKFEQATEDIASKLAPLQGELIETKSLINDAFASALPAPNTKEFKAAVNSIASSMDTFKKGAFKGMGTDFKRALEEGDIASFYEKWGDEGRKLAAKLGDKNNGVVGVMNDYFKKDGKATKQLKDVNKQIEEINASAKQFQKITLDTGALWNGIRQNILQNFGLKRIIDQVMDFDNKLANLKKEFQIPPGNFKAASEAMADLTVKGAKFGLTTQESFEMVKTIGEEMKSTNVKNLSAIAQSVAAVPAAMGIAASEVGKITGELMFFSMNADKVQSSFKNISKYSAVFGQNATKVSKQFGEAYPKFKMMGMKGNEAAIASMAAQAEKLGINLASSVQSSKDFLDIGEAMESAADLSLLGGAAAQVSYADLMQARLDPKKMIEIQDKITSGLGKFNKMTGEVDFGYADLVQLREQAKALGIDQEVLYKRAKGQREDAAKAAMFDKNMFGKLSPEEKQFLLSKVVSKGGGKFAVEGFEGVKDLKNISMGQIKAQMEAATGSKKSIEQQAKERASFEETVNRMKGTLMALFNRFQPILQMLTNVLGKVIDVAQSFSNAISNIFGATVGKYVKASIALGAILLLTMGPSAMARFSGTLFRGITSPLKMLSGFGAKMAGAFKGSKAVTGTADVAKNMGSVKDIAGKSESLGKGGSLLSRLGSPAQILATAAAIVALGLAFLMIGKGIKLATEGMAAFVNSFKGLNPAQLSAVKGALLGLGIGIAVLLGIMGALVYSGIGLAGAGLMLSFGAAVMMVGAGVYLTAKGLAALATAMAGIGKNVGGLIKGSIGLMALAGTLVLISPALVIFGVASLVAVPGMMALGYLLKGLGATKGVNPKVVESIANSMGSMAWGLFKLGAAAVVAPLAILAAMALNSVASALGKVSKFDPKQAIAFGNSLNSISSSVVKGMLKLALVGVVALPAMLGAKSMVYISTSLNNIKPINSKNLEAFGKSLEKIGKATIVGMLKLALIAFPALLATGAAKRMAAISIFLNSIKPINVANLVIFGNALGQITGKVMLGVVKLGLLSLPLLFANKAASLLASTARNLGLVKAPNIVQIALFGIALSMISGKVMWGVAKLALLAIPLLAANKSASLMASTSRFLGQIKAPSVPEISKFGSVLSVVANRIFWGVLKLGGLAAPLLLANKSASLLASTSRNLGLVKAPNTVQIALFGLALSYITGRVMLGVVKLGLLVAPLLLASKSASLMASTSRNLAAVKAPSIPEIAKFGASLSLITGKVFWGVTKLGLLFAPLALANKSASLMASTSKYLSQVKAPSIPDISKFGSAVGLISGKVIWGVTKLGLIYAPLLLANKSASLMASTSKSLASIKAPSILEISKFGQSLGLISGKVIFGVTKLGLLYFPLVLASRAARLMVSTSKSLGLVKAPNTAAMAAFGSSLSVISGKVMFGIIKLGLLFAPLVLANRAARLMVGTSMSLALVKAPNIAAMAKFGASLSAITGKVMWGVLKLGLLVAPLAIANKSAQLLASTSKYLSQVTAPNLKGIAAFGSALGQLTKKLMWGVIKLGLLVVPLALASVSAMLIARISTTLVGNAKTLISLASILNQIPIINIKRLLSMAQVLGSSMPRVANGVLLLARINPLIPPAKVAARGLKHIAYRIKAIPQVFFLGLRSVGLVLSSQMPRVRAGVILLSRVLPYIPAAIISARGLAVVARAIRLIPRVFFLGLSSLGTVLSTQMPKVIVGLSRLIKVIPLIPSSILAARGVAAISRTLRTIAPINAKAIMDLAKVVNDGGSQFFKGILKWFAISIFMGRAVRTIASVSKIFLSLNSIGKVDGPKVLATLPLLNKMAGSLASFAGIATMAPMLVISSVAVRILGRSLGVASKGFTTFAQVPWDMITGASRNLVDVVKSLNTVANKVSISPNLSTLARTLYILGFAMKSVSVGFSSAARSMAEFNVESEKLKINTGKAEITAKTSAARAVTEKAAVAGARKPVAAFTPTAPAGGENIRVAPIEINLKLNGMQIQKLITEANFYRT